jgi:hypothetical protein
MIVSWSIKGKIEVPIQYLVLAFKFFQFVFFRGVLNFVAYFASNYHQARIDRLVSLIEKVE